MNTYSGLEWGVNGILKEEYLKYYEIKSLKQAKLLLDQSIELYNQHRPHLSIGMLTPELVHQINIQTEKLWKTYPRKSAILNMQITS
ncbi:MAG: integrase core domain-containing protein [Cyclobacteriaceae bacterium]|nr:integrase core domain-containing protein [Cyclobacteriaceae bacterium HetDA_MAG_MS6]